MDNFTPEQLSGLEALEVLKRIYTGLESEHAGYQQAIDLLRQRQFDLENTKTDLTTKVFHVLGCHCWMLDLECEHKQSLSPERPIGPRQSTSDKRQPGPAANARKPLSVDEIDLYIEHAFDVDEER